MYKAVIMISGILKIISINYARRNSPLLVRNIRIYVTGTNHMKNSEEDYPHKC